MSLRSFLFVPGDSERKLEKARQIDADALILDLEDGVGAENLTEATLKAYRAGFNTAWNHAGEYMARKGIPRA